MSPQRETPPGQTARLGNDASFPSRNDHKYIAQPSPVPQAKIERSPAVAAAIERKHNRLLAIKRGSIASLGNMAGASLDGTMEAIENVDDEAMLERAARFFENVRGFAKLLADFRDERERRQ